MGYLNSVAVGTTPVPERIFSIGMAVYGACVLTKMRSTIIFETDTPVLFHISAIDT